MDSSAIKFVIRVYFETIGEFIENYGPHVSEGGMTLMLTKELKPQDMVGIEFKLKSEYPLIQGKARVVEVIPEGKGYRVRVQFLELDEKSRQVIQQAIKMRGSQALKSFSQEPPKSESTESGITELSEDLLEVPELSEEEEPISFNHTLTKDAGEPEAVELAEESPPSSPQKELLSLALDDSISKERSRARSRIFIFTGITLVFSGLLLAGAWFLWFKRPAPPQRTQRLVEPASPTTALPEPTRTAPSPHTQVGSPSPHTISPLPPTGIPQTLEARTLHQAPPPEIAPPSRTRERSMEPRPLPPARKILKIEAQENSLKISMDGGITESRIKGFLLKDPYRFVVDFKGIELLRGIKVTHPQQVMVRLRTGNHPGFARLVFDLDKPKRFQIKIKGDTVWITPEL